MTRRLCTRWDHVAHFLRLGGENSDAGTRTRVAWVKARYSNQLDYIGHTFKKPSGLPFLVFHIGGLKLSHPCCLLVGFRVFNWSTRYPRLSSEELTASPMRGIYPHQLDYIGHACTYSGESQVGGIGKNSEVAGGAVPIYIHQVDYIGIPQIESTRLVSSYFCLVMRWPPPKDVAPGLVSESPRWAPRIRRPKNMEYPSPNSVKKLARRIR